MSLAQQPANGQALRVSRPVANGTYALSFDCLEDYESSSHRKDTVLGMEPTTVPHDHLRESWESTNRTR